MTREETIDILENEKMCVNNETCQREECATCSLVMDKDKILTALDMALSALRPVSREQVEKVWRGCEWCNGEHSNNGEISAYAEVECEGCDVGDDCPNAHSSEDPCYGLVDRVLSVNFCPVCGAPMTDEAVQMVMERLEELRDEKG